MPGTKTIKALPRQELPTATSIRLRSGSLVLVALVWGIGMPASGLAQTVDASPGLLKAGSLLDLSSLPSDFASTLQKMGGRMTDASTAQVVLTGKTTDSTGSRAAQITIQAPGLMSYREETGLAVTFDGAQFGTAGSAKAGANSNQDAILESFLAHFPDAVCLQLAGGGIWRRLGSHFRTKPPSAEPYTGPYWTMWAFSPAPRTGLTAGRALQQSLYIAIDESTWLISEVRVVTKTQAGATNVVETQFNNWVQQTGQWCPGQIARLENGKQVLSFQTTGCSAGVAAAAAAFKP